MATTATATFDYTALDPEPRRAATRHAKAITAHFASSTKAAIDIGRRLIELRQQLDGRQWRAWLTSEFRWTRSVASNYMQVAEKFGELDMVSRFQPSALYALARRYVPPRAITDAVALARAGQTISKAVARQLIRKYRPGSPTPAVTNLRRAIARMSQRLDVLAKSAPRRGLASLANELEQLASKLRRVRRKPNRPASPLARRTRQASGRAPSRTSATQARSGPAAPKRAAA